MAGLAEGLPILYNSVVQDIHYSESRVRVSTASKSFEGESLNHTFSFYDLDT